MPTQSVAFIEAGQNRVAIGNGYISRVFELTKDKKFRTLSIQNFRSHDADDLVFQPYSEEFVVRFLYGKKIVSVNASSLFVEDILTKDNGNQKVLEVRFAPYDALGSMLSMAVRYEATDDKPYLYKTVSVSSSNPKFVIASIDTELIYLAQDVKTWKRPHMDEAYLTKFHSALGQPVYLNALYLGSEFPANDNNITEGAAHVRYFCGKAFEDMRKEDGKYTTWNTVVGVARSSEYEVLRADFLEYIKDISRPIYLRTQYNSWYDHMLDISQENIRDSFFEIEKGLTQNRVAPLHSYVVDDGYVDYDSDFWSFNEKFPNELYESSKLAKNFASDFGLWLGPRGGYNPKTYSFAKKIEKAKKGGVNKEAHDICTANHTYQHNLEALFLDFQKKFDINYWKLDGFLLRSCKSKKHGHPVGGFQDMYCFTDHWENWVRIFNKMHDQRAKEGKSLWINQTSYCNASPWYLQFTESLWIQNSSDIGFLDKTGGGEKMEGKDYDRMLSYRDDRYFDFVETRAYQFPLSNIYNHEPIYGNTAKIQMTDDEYRKYMYMIATRGTAFWELYYSFNMMNDAKWKINADVLHFLKDNFSILRNAKLIGKSPKTGSCYGYSAWDKAEGIVSVRNPLARSKTFSFTLDRLIGVAEDAKDLKCATILPYTEDCSDKLYQYGDTIELELAPHEIRIFRFGQGDTAAPKLTHTEVIDDKHIILTFDKHVVPVSFPEGSTYTLLENYNEILVTLSEPMQASTAKEGFGQILKCTVRDIYGNEKAITTSATYYENHVVANGVVSGKEAFTIRMRVDDAPKDCILWTQGKDLTLHLQNGKVVFDCMGLRVHSDLSVAGHRYAHIDLVREKNGMLKVYVDGILSGGVYDEKHLFDYIDPSKALPSDRMQHESVKECIIYDRAFAFNEVR